MGFLFKPSPPVTVNPAISRPGNFDVVDKSYKIYPFTLSLSTGAGQYFRADSISNLQTSFASAKIASGIQAEIEDAQLFVHSATALAAYPAVIPRIHIVLLETEAGATVTSTKYGSRMTEALAQMSNADLWNFTEIGEIRLQMRHADAGDYWFMGEAQCDLTKLLRKLKADYQKLESENRLADLKVVHLVAVLESNENQGSINTYAELRFTTRPAKRAFKSMI
jgi:hypothetical protein